MSYSPKRSDLSEITHVLEGESAHPLHNDDELDSFQYSEGWASGGTRTSPTSHEGVNDEDKDERRDRETETGQERDMSTLSGDTFRSIMPSELDDLIQV
jgi:hypothetical protein